MTMRRISCLLCSAAWLAALAAPVPFAGSASAQDASAEDVSKVTGTVTLSGRMAPLEDVPLALCRTSPEGISPEDGTCLRTVTDHRGNFAFSDVSPGTYDLIGQSYSKREFGASVDVKPESDNYFIIAAPN